MDIFMDLISTQSVTVSIFVMLLVIFLAAVGGTVLVLWLWDRFHQPKETQSPLADWYDSYAEPERQEAKERMDTLSRPAEAPQTPAYVDIAAEYEFDVELHPVLDVATLTDTRFKGLRNNQYVMAQFESMARSHESLLRRSLKHARTVVNRRAVVAGLKPKGKPRNRKKTAVAA